MGLSRRRSRSDFALIEKYRNFCVLHRHWCASMRSPRILLRLHGSCDRAFAVPAAFELSFLGIQSLRGTYSTLPCLTSCKPLTICTSRRRKSELVRRRKPLTPHHAPTALEPLPRQAVRWKPPSPRPDTSFGFQFSLYPSNDPGVSSQYLTGQLHHGDIRSRKPRSRSREQRHHIPPKVDSRRKAQIHRCDRRGQRSNSRRW